jgi:hypothetical protein
MLRWLRGCAALIHGSNLHRGESGGIPFVADACDLGVAYAMIERRLHLGSLTRPIVSRKHPIPHARNAAVLKSTIARQSIKPRFHELPKTNIGDLVRINCANGTWLTFDFVVNFVVSITENRIHSDKNAMHGVRKDATTDMITWLQYSKTGNFYQRTSRLTKVAVSDCFKAIRTSTSQPSRNLIHHVCEKSHGAVWSAIAFFYDRDPAFLDLPADHDRERICGFVLLIEYQHYVAVFKAGLKLPTTFKERHLRSVGSDRVEAATARAGATFEQVRLRNMHASRYAMRTKMLEAHDLRSVLSPSGTSRYVPAGFRTREADIHYTATPGTGRIAVRSDRIGHEKLIQWAVEVVDRLTDTGAALSPFIGNFARPIPLTAMPSDLQSTSIAIDVAALNEQLFEEPIAFKLIRVDGDGNQMTLSYADVTELLEALALTFEVRRVKKELRIIDPRKGKSIGEIRIGKSRISLRRFNLPELEDIYVDRSESSDIEDAEPLKRVLDRENRYTVLFNKIDVVYMEESLYRDPSLIDGGERFLGYLHANSSLEATTSEKGSFSPAHKEFDHASVFRVVVNELSSPDDILACDDLGDEWADFIGVNSQAQQKALTFYHAKHGDPSLSASAFHASVGQAIKNLQHLRLEKESLDVKRTKWESNYNNDLHQTQIPRMFRGSFAQMRDRVRETVDFPDTIRRVCIVTDSLSRREVAATFAAAKTGSASPAHFVQLYALLMGFFSACTEVGAFPAVICRP